MKSSLGTWVKNWIQNCWKLSGNLHHYPVAKEGSPIHMRQLQQGGQCYQNEAGTWLPSLEEKRKQSQLITMYKVVNHHTAIPLPDYIIRPRARVTRSQQQHRFTGLSSTSDSYKFSFFPRILKDWDDLPQHRAALEQFKEAIIAE